jgi:ATP-dependent exoDNAse (exonuclease V) beta subunit
LYYTSELRFSLKCSKSIRRAFRHIRALEFLRARKKTRAVFGMMQLFDRIYDTKVRSTGNLTFSDLPYLLCHRDPETREAILGNADRVMEARLDNEISHYMFDEFQDTSDIQYLAFDGMIRELAAGESERFRSFFCVGDIKQSIYQWRDGNPGLFAYLQHLLAPAAAQKGYDPGDSLTLSYRTSWYVLETVNRIFAPGYDGDSPFFADAVEKMKFETHRAGKDMEGFAALIECPKESSRDTVNAVGKAKTIFEIIRRINPLKKALSVGILVQKNDTVETFAEELRDLARRAQWDLPVSADGKVTISDSMAFNLFRFMLIMAEHPQDKLAREFIETVTFETRESTPGEPDAAWILKKMRFQEDADLRDALREELFRSGIAGIARRFP